MEKELDVFIGIEEEDFHQQGNQSMFVGQFGTIEQMAIHLDAAIALLKKYDVKQIYCVVSRTDFFPSENYLKHLWQLQASLSYLAQHIPDLAITLQLSIRNHLRFEYSPVIEKLVEIPNLHIMATVSLPPDIAAKCSIKMDVPQSKLCHVLDYQHDREHTTRYSQYQDVRIDILQELGLK